METNTGISVQVIKWNTDEQEVAIHFRDLEKLVTLNAEGARHMAFLLMECADFINPPFESDDTEPESTEDSISIFGPYDDSCIQDNENEEDEEE